MEQQILLSQLDPDGLRDLIRATMTEVMDKQAPVPTELKYLTRLEVCERFKISLPTFHEYQKKGLIRTQRFGRRVLVAESDLIAALREVPTRKRSRR